MRYSSINNKNAAYDEQHIVYIGTHTGSLKKIDVTQENPYLQVNLEDLEQLKKGCGVTTMHRTELDILLGREDGVVKTFSIDNNRFVSTINAGSKIIGLCSLNERTIVANEKGELIYFKKKKQQDTVQLCDNISRMRQCPMNPSNAAIGGKDRNNNLKVIDLATKKIIFNSKNVPNDELDLEVPVWDTDMGFLSANALTTCSRYGYVRVYDVMQQRRPVHIYKNDKEQISYTAMAIFDSMIYVGSNTGLVRAFDSRSLKQPVHTYKGALGSITSLAIDATGDYLIAGGLDRHVRIYNTASTALLYQCYAKSKVTQVLLESMKKEVSDEETVTEQNTNQKRKDVIDPEYDELFDKMETVEETMPARKSTKRRKKISEEA